MKRIFRFLFFLVILLLASAFILPIVFKGSIVDRIKQEANANLNAKLDFKDVDVSLISTFPYFGFSMEGLEITGVDKFEGQKLVSVQDFGLYIDLMSVISGDKYSIEKIAVEGVDLHILVLEDGSANYDIAKIDSTATTVETESAGTSAFSIALQSYSFNSANIRYEDRQGDMDFIVKGLNHQGSGDFTENIVDLRTVTEAESMSFIMEGMAYLNRVHLASDFDLKMDQEKFKFTFGKNTVALNGLQLDFEGMLAMPDDAISMDLKFGSPSNSFKSLISLIPALYYQDFDELKTKGEFQLEGEVKGNYQGDIYPSFDIKLLVREGFFQYPDLPSSVDNVNIDLQIKNNSRNLSNMLVNLSRMDADVAGSRIRSSLRLVDPMDDVKFDFIAQANADLSDLSKAMPMEGYDMAGKLDMDMNASGRMSMIDNEQYEDIKAGGYLVAKEMSFGGDSLGLEIAIPQASLKLNPREAILGPTQIVYQDQSMELEGSLENLLPFALRDDLLKGELDFYSPHLDLMALAGEEVEGEEASTTAEGDTAAMTVIRLPQNINFNLSAKVDTLLYDEIKIESAIGDLNLNEGIANLDLGMKLLEGDMTMKGAYNSVPAQPLADFRFEIRKFSFKESYNQLDMVQQIAPLMQNVQGNYDLGMDLNTLIGDDMSPIMNSVNATGFLKTRSVQMGGKVLNQLATFLQNPDYQELGVSDVDLEFSIEDGKIEVEPFDFKLAGQKAELGGSMTLEQELDFDLNSSIFIKNVKAQQYMSQFQSLSSGTLPLMVKIGGTATDPEVRPSFGDLGKQIGDEIKQKITDAVDSAKTKVKEEVNNKLEELVSAAEAQGDKLIAEARSRGDQLKAEAKKQADKLRSEGEKAAQKILDEAGSNPLKQAAAKSLAEKTRKEANAKAQQLEDEAAKKADDLVKAAEQQKQKLIEDARAKAQI